MTRMKHTIPFLVLLAALVSCREHQAVVRDTIPYVKQIASVLFSSVKQQKGL